MTITVQAQPYTIGDLAWQSNRGSTSNTLSDGLIAYYRFEQNGLSSFGVNHLQTNGITLYTASGKINYGYNAIYGVTSFTNYFYLNTEASVLLTTNKTFAVWFKILDATTEYRLIFSKFDFSDIDNQDYILYTDGGPNINFSVVQTNSITIQNVATNVVTQNTWYFAVAWVDFSTSNTWLQINNGIPSSMSFINKINTSTNRFKVGNDDDQSENHIIDEMSIWSRILTPLERSNLWNNANGITYPFP